MGNIFLKPLVFEKFLEIALEAKQMYGFTVQSLCLTGNRYRIVGITTAMGKYKWSASIFIVRRA